MKIIGEYETNPVTARLLREGVLQVYEHREEREIHKDGETYKEIAITLRYIDRRQFNKGFRKKTTKALKDLEGNPKGQMLFLIDAAVEKSINKDSIYLSYKDFEKICVEKGIKVWPQSQFSKMIKWAIENEWLYRSKKIGKYFIDSECTYNGSLVNQLGLSDETSKETSSSPSEAIPDSSRNA